MASETPLPAERGLTRSPCICGSTPPGDPESLDKASLCSLKAGKEELVAPLFSGKANWFWKLPQAPFPSFPSEKPGPRDNWEGSSSRS